MPAAAALVPTRVQFSAEAELGAPVLPPLQFAASGKEPPQTAQFRIALSRGSEVRYCFLQDSSGDAALDDQARRYLLLARFPAIENEKSKIENGDLWTTATIEWGNDLAVPSTNPAEPRVP